MATTSRRPQRSGTMTAGNGGAKGVLERERGRDGERLSPEPRYAKLGIEIQRFNALRTLPIGLSDAVRRESCEALNAILADSEILYQLYKKHHWNVAGPTFYELHLLFDKHADEQLELIDLLAERV